MTDEAPDAWLFSCHKPGTHMTFASVDDSEKG